jgi:hypothetical protein
MCWDSTLRFALEAQDPSRLLGANQARLSDQGADLAAPTRRGHAGFAGAADLGADLAAPTRRGHAGFAGAAD